jgi:glycosyltransferase involved in cell wall biosynthesis
VADRVLRHVDCPSSMPLVSVIIPTYNRARLLAQTLESVRAQSVRDYEIVVVDDGSTDTTAELLDGLGYAIQVCRIKHSGQSAARNAGLRKARGPLVAFLDSDDLWEPQFLEKMTRALEANSRLGFVYCDYSIFDDRGFVRCRDMAPEHKLEGRLFTPLLQCDFICTGAILIRRECFQQVGVFDPDLAMSEDWDMWLRLSLKHQAGYVDEPLARIRASPESPSREPNRLYPMNLRVLEKIKRDFPEETRPLDPLIRRQIARSHLALMRRFGVERRLLPFVQHLGLMLAAKYL